MELLIVLISIEWHPTFPLISGISGTLGTITISNSKIPLQQFRLGTIKLALIKLIDVDNSGAGAADQLLMCSNKSSQANRNIGFNFMELSTIPSFSVWLMTVASINDVGKEAIFIAL